MGTRKGGYTMKNFYYEGQRFKNGNLNIRFSVEAWDPEVGVYDSVGLSNEH